MLPCRRLIELGDLSLTLPTAAALLAALLASRSWRMAFCWSVLFASCVLLVGASKIAFMGWGAGWPAACFKALSGHAAGVTAVFPMLFFLLLHHQGRRAGWFGLALGLVLGAVVAWWLVQLHEHSAMEAVAGWLAGALVNLGALRLAGVPPPLQPLPSAAAFLAVFLTGSWLMQWAPVGYWMILAARFLSGNRHLFSLGYL
ncbi:hypothetical protein [Massilia sp. CF038]|uniref:hypothetical protein n=1 Tax=Massilia sp. CF038 TaxID=1881045 RepID=UPI00091BD10A|nr:hypothetical protein [Massilia sp. CF038]SHH02640.1 hypothetical protein SAMN05428948_2392 [Massilia sp. CF038]